MANGKGTDMTGLQIFITACGASLITVIGQIVLKLIDIKQKKKEKKNNGEEKELKALRILLYDRIKHLAKTYIQRGSITAEELEDLETMHGIYHNDLDGNGFLDKMMAGVHSLPIKG